MNKTICRFYAYLYPKLIEIDMKIKVIITGATGLVGEGVLLECLEHPNVEEVLMVNRKPYLLKHPKLKECLVSDFLNLEIYSAQLSGYNACFYCAGISSRGLNEEAYSHITYDITLHFAKKILDLNPELIFGFISGSHTDASGKIMWAKVKGKTENALMELPFKKEYNFRPGLMKPTAGQKNIKGYYKIISGLYPVFHFLFPNQTSTLKQVGLAMINSVLKGYPKQILEIQDIKLLAAETVKKH
ncbi:NAD-dependent epimerase/dehydratase family protein [Pedobacter nototheniae]|uniref:NAD-dependent epimerase/dehydratase family protein n=1 Tax=Pedobacter nototheniae TaxID=2488994 RepID=UPI00292E9D9A|nr:NAD-dependent epimerase/dehydratase family protein [Pedobacter nototheniae]